MLRFYCAALLLLGSAFYSKPACAQASSKGDIFIYWGWNRDAYTKSSIRFYGDDYDFKIKDAVAKDKPEHFGYDPFLRPKKITIPQTNFKAGYFIKDNLSFSFGVDHMKYVVVQNQEIAVDGYINKPNSPYAGVYDNTTLPLKTNFLTFEHTDGLNYLNLELNHFTPLKLKSGWKVKHLELTWVKGAGIGVMLPKTNSKLLENPRNDDFHVAGLGCDIKTGINLKIWRYFMLRTEVKGGYINMPYIRTTASDRDHASQDFFFVQGNFLFGLIIPTKKATQQ